MNRLDNLDLDLECDDGGGVSRTASVFGGMFRRSSKSSEPSAHAQDGLSVNGDLSKSNDSLSDNNKDKGGMLKAMFKKATKSGQEEQTQATLSSQNPELSVSSDSLTDKTSKDKSGMFSGILKRSPKPGHTRRSSQDLLEVPVSNDSLSEKANTKESGGILSGMFKKSPKRTKSQDDLSEPSEVSGSSDNLSVNSHTKETGGMFSGIFKKPLGSQTHSQEDLLAPTELSGSSDSLSENHPKEKGGMFSGMFRKKGAKSQNDLSVDDEVFAGGDAVHEKSSKDKEKREHPGESNEDQSTAEKPKTKQNGFNAAMKSTFYTNKPKSENEEMENGDDKPNHKQGKLSGMMTKLNPFRSANKQEKHSDSDEESAVSSEKSSGNKQNFMAETLSKLNPFHSAEKKDTEHTETQKENETQVEEKPELVKSNVSHHGKKERSETPVVPPRPRAEEMRGMSTYDKVKPRSAENNKDNTDMTSRERKGKPTEPPVVPPKPSKELNRPGKHDQQKQNNQQNQSGDDGVEEESAATKAGDEMKLLESKTTKVKKQKHINPFMPRTGGKLQGPSDDEQPLATEEKDDEGQDKKEKTKEKKHKHNPFMPRTAGKAPFDGEDQKEEEESSAMKEKDDEAKDKHEKTKVKKQKRNPFIPRTPGKLQAPSDDEGLKEEGDSSATEEKKDDEEAKDKKEKTKVKKRKKFNPFMAQVKAKANQRRSEAAENEGPKRTVFDQLEDLRIDPSGEENYQDVDGLMEWWKTVEPWEDLPSTDDMTEKEEAKAFAMTAEKVQKGIRVFNKLFSERAESLWQHVIDLNSIADGLDKFNKNTKIAQITGGSTSAIGGIATVAGIALAPVTMGTSLIVTAVGLGVATAGGLTSAGAGISNQVNNTLDRKKVEKIVEDYQQKMADLNKCLTFIKQGIENLRKFDLIKMKKYNNNDDLPRLSARFYEDGAMAGKAILINANEIMRFVQIANVAGTTAAKAVQIASMATGVLTGLFVAMDIYFVAKDSKELKKGAKSDFAAKIREVAQQLHDGLVELNTIREELQCSTRGNDEEKETEDLNGDKKDDGGKKDEEDKYDSSEDEINRIKKAIKKDLENREYV
ncbi:apolipoprotein L1 isoform 3-T3 [Pholidichthys leucotaenia]